MSSWLKQFLPDYLVWTALDNFLDSKWGKRFQNAAAAAAVSALAALIAWWRALTPPWQYSLLGFTAALIIVAAAMAIGFIRDKRQVQAKHLAHGNHLGPVQVTRMAKEVIGDERLDRKIPDSVLLQLGDGIREIRDSGKAYITHCSDPECHHYASRIRTAFEMAGWNVWLVDQMDDDSRRRLPQDGGIFISAGNHMLYQLEAAFSSVNIPSIPIPQEPGEDIALISIGLNPGSAHARLEARAAIAAQAGFLTATSDSKGQPSVRSIRIPRKVAEEFEGLLGKAYQVGRIALGQPNGRNVEAAEAALRACDLFYSSTESSFIDARELVHKCLRVEYESFVENLRRAHLMNLTKEVTWQYDEIARRAWDAFRQDRDRIIGLLAELSRS